MVSHPRILKQQEATTIPRARKGGGRRRSYKSPEAGVTTWETEPSRSSPLGPKTSWEVSPSDHRTWGNIEISVSSEVLLEAEREKEKYPGCSLLLFPDFLPMLPVGQIQAETN